MLKITISLFCVVYLAALGQCNEIQIGFPMTERLSHGESLRLEKIVGGENAEKGEFPYQISFQHKKNHICGGCIINNKVVLTAAHCVHKQNIKEYEVVAGIISLKNPGKDEQRRAISSAHVHPNYSGSVAPDDIAVLILSKPFVWTEYVKPISIPFHHQEFDKDTMLSGWGSTSRTNTPVYPDILQKVKVPIIKIDDCFNYYKPADFNKATNLCTGPINGRVSACSGDSGGPLAKTLNGITYVVGLVSWGRIPCGNGSPTVYTKVSHFDGFIHNATKHLE